MTSADHNDLMPSQKLQWVTPKISLMGTGDTEGKRFKATFEYTTDIQTQILSGGVS